jgi:hypothetical protein
MFTGEMQGQFTQKVYDLSHRPNNGIDQLVNKLFYQYKIGSATAPLHDLFGYYLENKGLIKWAFHKADDPSGTNEIALVYDVRHDLWLVDDNYHFYAGCSMQGRNFVADHRSPLIYEDEIDTVWDDFESG